MSDAACLVLRLGGPLQSWGSRSQFNRRETDDQPTKSGIIGLLAAALGRRRQDPIEDLVGLALGVRIDQPGSLLRDYHTVSDYRGRPLPAAKTNAAGLQMLTGPAKHTHVTTRYYLQDALFVAAIGGPADVLLTLEAALRRPAFPLALGRRACPPTQPLLLPPPPMARRDGAEGLWSGTPLDLLRTLPWQASSAHQRRVRTAEVDLPITVDDTQGDDVRVDVPASFDPLQRAFGTRRVRHVWTRVAVPGAEPDASSEHDPFALLGW